MNDFILEKDGIKYRILTEYTSGFTMLESENRKFPIVSNRNLKENFTKV